MTLTKRQKEILDYIETHIRSRGYAPTLEEIGSHFRLDSVATVHKHVTHLVEKGLVRRVWNQNRSIELAGRFAKGPAQAYKLAKWAVYRALTLDLEAASEHEWYGQNFLLGTQDVKNAVKSFIEKKPPEFKGR